MLNEMTAKEEDRVRLLAEKVRDHWCPETDLENVFAEVLALQMLRLEKALELGSRALQGGVSVASDIPRLEMLIRLSEDAGRSVKRTMDHLARLRETRPLEDVGTEN